MATVTANTTRISTCESTTNWAIIGGTGSVAALADIHMQGSNAIIRQFENCTDFGFQYNNSSGINLANNHVGMWVYHNFPLSITNIKMQIGTSTTNYDRHTILTPTNYPKHKGWVRVWVNVSRTPDSTGGTGLTESSAQYFGAVATLPDITSTNVPGMLLDAIDYTTTGLTLTGTSGVFENFYTSDDNETNKYGVILKQDGVYFVLARLTVGSATATTLTDSAGIIIYPTQSLVADSFMGTTFDLQNASTAITLTKYLFQSVSTSKMGDFVVTSTSGSLSADACTFSRIRVVTLTSTCTITGSTLSQCGTITGAGATITDCVVTGSTATAALSWNVNTDTDGKIDGTSFVSSGTGHAIELGSSVPSSITLTNVSFSGYASSDGSTGNETIYNNAGKAVTIYVSGGTTPTIRNGTSASTTVINAVTVALTVKSASTASAIENARVLVEAASGGALPAEESVTITRSGTTATVSHTAHGIANGSQVVIRGAAQDEYNGVFTITYINANSYSYTVSGTPATPATGTITSSAVILAGLTNASGVLQTTTFNYSADQPIVGKVRKSSSAPYYKSYTLSGTISSSGYSNTLLLISDA